MKALPERVASAALGEINVGIIGRLDAFSAPSICNMNTMMG